MLQLGDRIQTSNLRMDVKPRSCYLPTGWEKEPGAKPQRVPDDSVYYPRMGREGRAARPVYFHSRRPGATTGKPFYIMESKVSGEQYAKFFAEQGKQSQKQNWQLKHGDERKPATAVTPEDAHKFAEWLVGPKHGFLPRAKQWDKAAAGGSSPMQARGRSLDPGTRQAWGQSANRAESGEAGPMECNAAKDDVSVFGLHDMAGNGLNWMCNLSDTAQNLKEVPLGQDEIPEEFDIDLRSYSFLRIPPLTFDDLKDKSDLKKYPGLLGYAKSDQRNDVSFRVVLEPW